MERDEYQEISYEDLKGAVTSVQLLRNQLEDWIDKPFFDDTVVGCFVRVNIGTAREGESSYRLCEVVGIREDENSVQFNQTTRRNPNPNTRVLFRCSRNPGRPKS